MSIPIPQPLPLPKEEYDKLNEVVARRQIEQNILQLNNDLRGLERQKAFTDSVRRHQFLLMGAASG